MGCLPSKARRQFAGYEDPVLLSSQTALEDLGAVTDLQGEGDVFYLVSSGSCILIYMASNEDFAEDVLKKAKAVTCWWRSHEEIYPVLSLIAPDLLSIPASTVASEADFSAGGRVVSEKRASLNLYTIQALICLKDWKLAEAMQQDKEQDELRAEEEQNAKWQERNG